MSIDYSSFLYPKPRRKKKKDTYVKPEVYYTVFNECKGTCQLCGIQRELQLHHINGRGKNLTNNIMNCIMLCDSCHRLVHTNKKKYRPILMEIRDKHREEVGL